MTQHTEATADAEIVEAPVESPTTTETEPEANTDVAEKPVNQEAVQKRINDITAQKYEEKARADELQRQLDELSAKPPAQPAESIAPTQAQTAQPPAVDLQYDNPEEYNRQLADYQRDIARQTYAEEQKATQTAEMQRLEQERAIKAQAEKQQAIINSATTHNVELSEVESAAVKLSQWGIRPEVSGLLLDHESAAPLMTHLVNNPAEFDALNNSESVLEAARKLDSLQPQSLQRKVTSAPEPVQPLTGMPAREQSNFEQICPGAQFK